MNMTDRIGEALLSLNEDALIHVERATGLAPEGKAVGKPLKARVCGGTSRTSRTSRASPETCSWPTWAPSERSG